VNVINTVQPTASVPAGPNFHDRKSPEKVNEPVIISKTHISILALEKYF
jgi:hypothetical protein